MKRIIKKIIRFYYFKDLYQNRLKKKKADRILKIKKQVNKKNIKIKHGQKILFGMSFTICEPCKIHDFLLSQSLVLRGASIIPIICGGLQEGQCSVFGGIWGRYIGDDKQDKIVSKKNCETCINSDLSLWKKWCNIDSIFLSKYIDEEDKIKIKKTLDNYDLDSYKDWVYEDMPIGRWALDVLRNNELVGCEAKIENYKPKFLGYAYNILLMVEALKKALANINPDIIISNDSFYYPWSILEFLAKKNNIPFYSCWVGGLKNHSFYAKDQAAANFDLSKPWQHFRNLELSKKEKVFMKKFLASRVNGKQMLLNSAKPKGNSDVLVDENITLDFIKPTALLVSNVIWDLAALNKDIQFNGMVDWIFKLIKFFEYNPQWQLIIKPHPAEENKLIPQTRQQVVQEIFNKFGDDLPKNVVILNPRTKYSVYDLFPYIKIGLVYTTTTALEMASFGIPVVTAAKGPYHDKGFTYDTDSKNEYFDIINKLFTTKSHEKNRAFFAGQAKKFFYLYYKRYFIDLGFFESDVNGVSRIKIGNANDLILGKNKKLDYLCDSILNHLPIISEDRLPPF